MAFTREDEQNSARIGVSPKLGEIKSNILRAGNELERELHSRVAGFVSDTLDELESHVCRIAFIGQIKAGKSSLINALIQKPGFLPTDVNPSTAVVTKIFFGSQAQTGNTALFHFFTENEWEGLVSSDGREIEGPGLLSLPSTKQKLGELQKRAEKRLGANYSQVLGKHHLFSAVTPQILEQYVSAGDYSPQRQAVNKNLYSDVTKMAEIFLDEKPFIYPSVMIDTPGVNDFFFIRDEITHSNIADADIYILVLSAQQPLSSGDISLLRLLRGLQRDKIIAVINRIDTLGSVADESENLEAFVRETLRRECPQATIPIVLASASWGTAALNSGRPEGDARLTPNLIRYAERLGFGKQLALNGSNAGRAVNASDAPMLLACSGIPRLVELISQSISNAVTEEQLLPSAATLSAIAHNTAISSRFSLRALAPEKWVNTKSASLGEDIRRQAYGSLKQLESLIRDVEHLLQQTLQDCERAVASEFLNLERYIHYSIEAFAKAQADAYLKAPKAQSFFQDFGTATLRFRSELADDFARYFTEINKIVLDKQREAENALRAIVKTTLPALDNVVQFGLISRRTRPPSTMSLGKTTALESAEFWNLKAAEFKRSPEELKQHIAAEFLIILKELMESARSDLKLSLSNVVRRLRLLAFSPILPLIEQVEKLALAYKNNMAAGAGGDAQMELAFMKTFESRMKENITRHERLAAQLSDIKKQCFLVPNGVSS